MGGEQEVGEGSGFFQCDPEQHSTPQSSHTHKKRIDGPTD